MDMARADTRQRIDRLDLKLTLWRDLAPEKRHDMRRELRALRDTLPECPNAHVRAWHAHRRAEADALARQVLPDAGKAPLLSYREFENHMLTEGLRDAAEAGEVRAQRKVTLAVNLRLLVGGLARVTGLSEAQLGAAAEYRRLFEASLIGAAGATDYAQPMVDTSAKATNPADGGIDARRRYAEAVRRLGMVASSLVEQVVCHEMSIRAVARAVEGNDGDQARQRVLCRIRAALDVLVKHFGLLPQGRDGVRADGPRAGDWSLPVR